ncbi:MAG TPA: hypothetical protein VHV79_06435 [Mycobacteriales bacterium]|nr:hypothetical protein [Mycobacteriales bacterium]
MKLSIATLGAASLVGLGAPSVFAMTAVSGAAGAASAAPKVGDSCLIGTWHDNASKTTTQWNGKTVKMHTKGGDIDHIRASGVDHDSWAKAKPLYGTVSGHKLTEVIRGHNLLHLLAKPHAHRVIYTEDGWTPKSTNRYVYRGDHSKGYLNQTGSYASPYRCTAKKLTFLREGKVVDTETRLSTKP